MTTRAERPELLESDAERLAEVARMTGGIPAEIHRLSSPYLTHFELFARHPQRRSGRCSRGSRSCGALAEVARMA